MTERNGFSAGFFSWVDIGTDIPSAKAFYGGLFGWESQDAGDPEQTGGYGFFVKNGKLVAGYGPQMNPGPPFWACYVATDDADAMAKVVEEKGGSVIMAPIDVMTAGRMAVFQDPSGAFFSVWQAGEHLGVQLAEEAGALAWVELDSRDVEGAKRFYPAVFGWTFETHEGEMPYTEWAVGGTNMAGLMEMPPMVPSQVPSFWMPYFGSDDVASSVQSVQRLGGTVLMPPTPVPGGGEFAVATDTKGAVFGLYRIAA